MASKRRPLNGEQIGVDFVGIGNGSDGVCAIDQIPVKTNYLGNYLGFETVIASKLISGLFADGGTKKIRISTHKRSEHLPEVVARGFVSAAIIKKITQHDKLVHPAFKTEGTRLNRSFSDESIAIIGIVTAANESIQIKELIKPPNLDADDLYFTEFAKYRMVEYANYKSSRAIQEIKNTHAEITVICLLGGAAVEITYLFDNPITNTSDAKEMNPLYIPQKNFITAYKTDMADDISSRYPRQQKLMNGMVILTENGVNN